MFNMKNHTIFTLHLDELLKLLTSDFTYKLIKFYIHFHVVGNGKCFTPFLNMSETSLEC